MTKLTELDPKSIGPYSILDRLGSGASGVVYKATDASGNVIALKVIRPEIADRPQVRQRLEREAHALQRVLGSRTVRVLDVDTTSERPYLAMEFVPGESLEEFITHNGPMKGSNLNGLLDALIEALESLQEAGIVHRDLKPSNVLIGPDGIKIVDFGISSLGESTGITETGVVLGTASWLSPEQISGEVVGPASDIFNLGLLVAYAATGRHPYGEGRADALMYRVVHTEPNLDGLTSYIAQVVAGCLKNNPSERISLAALSAMVPGISSGDIESESIENRPSISIPRTRIVSPTLEAPLAASLMSTSSDTEPRLTRFDRIKKKKIVFAALAVLILTVVSVFIVGITSESRDRAEREAYEQQFVGVLDAVENLEAINGKYIDDYNVIESTFFEYDWKKNGYGSFSQYVILAGSDWWIKEYSKVYSAFYEKANPKITELRALAFPEMKKKSDLILIKNAFTNHYDTWIDFAELYDQALDAYVYGDKSWDDTSAKFHERLDSEITATFRSACNYLGDLQPVDADKDYSPRIAEICES